MAWFICSSVQCFQWRLKDTYSSKWNGFQTQVSWRKTRCYMTISSWWQEILCRGLTPVPAKTSISLKTHSTSWESFKNIREAGSEELPTISIHVIITSISFPITICVPLVIIQDIAAIVTSISKDILVAISLVNIGSQDTVILQETQIQIRHELGPESLISTSVDLYNSCTYFYFHKKLLLWAVWHFMWILAVDQIPLATSRLCFEPHCGNPKHKHPVSQGFIYNFDFWFSVWRHPWWVTCFGALASLHGPSQKLQFRDPDKVCRCFWWKAVAPFW